MFNDSAEAKDAITGGLSGEQGYWAVHTIPTQAKALQLCEQKVREHRFHWGRCKNQFVIDKHTEDDLLYAREKCDQDPVHGMFPVSVIMAALEHPDNQPFNPHAAKKQRFSSSMPARPPAPKAVASAPASPSNAPSAAVHPECTSDAYDTSAKILKDERPEDHSD